jgi:hypothetical protein
MLSHKPSRSKAGATIEPLHQFNTSSAITLLTQLRYSGFIGGLSGIGRTWRRQPAVPAEPVVQRGGDPGQSG